MENTKFHTCDYLILLIIFLLPYSESGPWFWLYSIPFIGTAGPAFISLICSLYIYWISKKHRLCNRFKTISFLVWAAAIYSLFKLLQTINIVGYTEALTIYRKNYMYLLSFALIMNYMSNMNHDLIKRLITLMIKLSIPITIVYFIQCFGVPIFTSNLLTESAGGVQVTRNILGFPPIIPVIFSMVFIHLIFTYEKKSVYLCIMLLTACFISYTRNLMITAVLIMAISTLCYVVKYGLKQNYKLFIYGVLLFIVLVLIAPNSISFWSNLIDSTFNVQLEKGVGTYAVRQRLIETALQKITDSDAWFTGIGYIRDAAKGEYSLVLGTDTFLAPIIWCEGVIGIILRCLPLVWLLAKSIVIFKSSNDEIVGYLSLVIAVSIISQIPNYVQTTIFMNYCYVFAQLFLIYVFLNSYIEQDSEYA